MMKERTLKIIYLKEVILIRQIIVKIVCHQFLHLMQRTIIIQFKNNNLQNRAFKIDTINQMKEMTEEIKKSKLIKDIKKDR
jgi:hypothetical protein